MTTTTAPFHQSARIFLQKILRVRFHLIKKQLSPVSNDAVTNAARLLNVQLRAFKYNDDWLMASFMERHADKIELTIPGKAARCHARLWAEYIALLEQAKNLKPTNTHA